MLPRPTADGRLQFRKRRRPCFPGAPHPHDSINCIHFFAMHIQIHGEAKRMARRIVEILTLLLAGTLSCAGPIYAQARPQAPPPAQPAPAPSADISQIETEAMGWLQGLIRINTTNPPGNELVAAKYIAAILTKEGISSEIFESTPGRGFIVARLSSSAVPDPSRALLLMA